MDKETHVYIFIAFAVDNSGTILRIPIAKRIIEGYSDRLNIASGAGGQSAGLMPGLPLLMKRKGNPPVP
ncbi:MAG: hypothetical protein K8I29_12710 [Alphaproteobacteria bacterium]|uniref:Uncharacterized protein n=1 Tax=Candidatus Nitrobium versatile TaxID=2884831 RepID=A0A953J7D1_9BACT|nr:hypothetical protein [Candidatus Nitrobium versatile]